MPCHVRSTSASDVRCASSLRLSPVAEIAARLARLAGWPPHRLIGASRTARRLRIAVEWIQGAGQPGGYSVVDVTVSAEGLHPVYLPPAAAAAALLVMKRQSATPEAVAASAQESDAQATNAVSYQAEPLGTVARRLREAAGLTRAQLSSQTGVSAYTIRNLETGRHATRRTILAKLQKCPAMRELAALTFAAGAAVPTCAPERGER